MLDKRAFVTAQPPGCNTLFILVILREQNSGLYIYILRYGLRVECFKGMSDYSTNRDFKPACTWADILSKINLCSNRKEFREKYTYEYRAALKKQEWHNRVNQLLPKRK